MKIFNKQYWTDLLRIIKRDITSKKKKGVIIVVVSILIGIYLGISAGLLWLLFLVFAFYDWDNRIIGVIALICLASCPFLLQFHQDAIAETMAVYAFFFLVMVVALQLIEYKRHPELSSEEANHEEK